MIGTSEDACAIVGYEQYRYPERFGILFDAYGSSKAGNMLDDNEKSIKKYIGVE